MDPWLQAEAQIKQQMHAPTMPPATFNIFQCQHAAPPLRQVAAPQFITALDPKLKNIKTQFRGKS